MLIELRVESYAVIDRAAVRLGPGLNVLSGETGAGKSIIVGALSLLLGERASSDAVRTGAERAVVEGVFDVSANPAVRALLEEQGIVLEDELLIVRREVAAEGRNRAWVNGSPGTVGLLGELGAHLADLHGQHEHQTLLRAEEQRQILDAFAGATELAGQVAAAHAEVAAAAARLAELDRRRREAEQRADYLRFQAGEIEAAGIRADEEAELAAEAARLEHASELAEAAERLHQELYAGERAMVGRLAELRRLAERLAHIDASLAPSAEAMEGAYFALQEVGRSMGDYANGVEHDPGRLDTLRRRQDLLFRLKAKYGPDLSDVIETGSRARAELDLIDRAGFERRELEAALAAARERHNAAAVELSAARTAAARKLEEAVGALLPRLGMEGGTFAAALRGLPEPGPHGAEGVELRVALNRGLEPRPLARVASGGELSRVMLALKTVLARVDRVPTLVFDEIDAGIGGRVAHRVAETLAEVARHHQVFVITHLAQLAARADHHHLVEKREREGSTLTSVTELTGPERVRELARMLGGDPESAASLEHARELLEGAPERVG